MWITCQIEKRDMRGAKRGDCAACPAARATNRIISPKFFAEVFWDGTIRICNRKDGEKAHEATPVPAVRRFVHAYDSSEPGKPPKPISFRVNIPKSFLREGVAA